MRKHLFVTLLLTCGLPFSGQMIALAAEAPQSAGQAATALTGTVLDENNEPVIGASIVPKGQKSGVATDAFGHFTIRVAPGTPLRVSYVGYKTAEIAAGANMTCYLQPTTEQLEQLVVVGYGTQKKANLTGAVATVDVARVMDSRPVQDVTKALQGAVPGLTITTGDGGINTASTIKIRGTGTLSNSQTSNPLIVVDGVPVDDLSFVNPDDIADISVLKDASSSAIYGTRAAFGVILITTKTPDKKDRVSVKYTNNFAWNQATTLPEYGSVPEQIEALLQTNYRKGAAPELFGMYLDTMLPYAQAWYDQNGGKRADYRVMREFKDWNDVGDYYQDSVTGATMFYADWDVAGIMFNNAAPAQKHNVSLEGTSGKTQYRLAFGYDSKEGLMTFNPDKLTRYTANASISTEIFSWLKAGARFNFADKRYYSPNMWGSGGNYTYMWRWGSYFGPYGMREDADGNAIPYRNIASRLQAGPDNDDTINTKIQAWMEASIMKDLTLHADFTYDVTNRNDNYSYLPVFAWNNWTNSAKAPEYMVNQNSTYAAQNNTKATLWTLNVFGTYAKTFAQNHNLKVMLGGTAEKYDYNYFLARRDVLIDNSLPYLQLTTGGADGTKMSISNSITHRATAGFFGRVNYDYKGIYLLEANGRYDGSSRFPANDQWAFFPSFSAGYRFSEESYFEPVKATNILTNGKIRASYGEIGNEAIGSNMFLSTVGKATGYWINSAGTIVNMYGTPSLVSSSLTWERVCTTDVGIDLGFFNNSLNLTFDWFQRDTKDMLGPAMTLPAVLGASTPVSNSGSLRTRGWELGLSWNHSFGDADVYASFNIYDGKTTITKYNNENQLLNNFYTGATYGDIWGFETDRYFEESDFAGKDAKGAWIYKDGIADQTGLQNGGFVFGPGDIKFKDLNGDGVINGGDPDMKDADGVAIPIGSARNHGDLKVIGNFTPRYEYSFRLGAAWKGFDIDMFFQGVGKRDFWTTSAFVMPFTRGADATYINQDSYNKMIFEEVNGKQTIVGYEIDQKNDYPCMFDGAADQGTISANSLQVGRFNFYPQSKYLMNLAYLRFKTLTVGYTLPVEITKKALIQKARVYFSADNLCNLYNGMHKYPIDPEIGSQWTTGTTYSNGTFGRTNPIMRTFSFGLQVTF